jgi:hypothetical protein
MDLQLENTEIRNYKILFKSEIGFSKCFIQIKTFQWLLLKKLNYTSMRLFTIYPRTKIKWSLRCNFADARLHNLNFYRLHFSIFSIFTSRLRQNCAKMFRWVRISPKCVFGKIIVSLSAGN